MMKLHYLIVLIVILLMAILFGQFSAMGECETGNSPIYSVHYDNGTVLNITENSEKFLKLNSTTMRFLEYIANRIERYVNEGILEQELIGTTYLVLNSDVPLEIHTKPGLNPDIPEGWTIRTKKVVIKMQEEVLGEERIFIYNDPESVISPWSSAANVDAIRSLIY
jgi:hypothetical protein